MRFLFLDLELNQPSRKIIQVGACVADFNSGLIVDELKLYINPKEKLNDNIVHLTGITQALVDRGVTLEIAYEKLKVLYKEHNCYSSPFTWGGDNIEGGDDIQILKAAMLKKADVPDWPFGSRSNDVKTLFLGHAIANRMSSQGGLSKAMNRVGLKFIGKKHDALDDAKNTFLIAHYLLMNKNT